MTQESSSEGFDYEETVDRQSVRYLIDRLPDRKDRQFFRGIPIAREDELVTLERFELEALYKALTTVCSGSDKPTKEMGLSYWVPSEYRRCFPPSWHLSRFHDFVLYCLLQKKANDDFLGVNKLLSLHSGHPLPKGGELDDATYTRYSGSFRSAIKALRDVLRKHGYKNAILSCRGKGYQISSSHYNGLKSLMRTSSREVDPLMDDKY